MPLTTVAELLQAVRQFALLEGRRLTEVVQYLEPRQTASVSAVTNELVEQGWFTQFQVDRLVTGQGESLSLGQYVLLERIGVGSVGEVFKARHRRLGRIDALKIIRPDQFDDPDAIARFQREARAAARLAHPNLVTIYDSDQVSGVYFLAMEYVEGTDLAKLVAEQGRLIPSEACDYIRQAALGLQHAHEQGMVHRDIKPHNLLVTAKTSAVKVLDLGLARLIPPGEEGEGPTDLLSKPETTVGAWDYLAPEQAQDAQSADIRADIYSLGCTFYHLLAGKAPFADFAGGLKLVYHKTTEPPLIEDFCPELPFGLGSVLRRMMAKEPEDRYQTPGEVADALLAYSQESALTSDAVVLSEAPTNTAAPPEFEPAEAVTLARRKLPAWIWLVAGSGIFLATVLCVAVVISGWWNGTRPETAPSQRQQPERYVHNSIGMKLVRVEPGQFVMGSPVDEKDRFVEELPHEVTIARPFLLGASEVTQAQFQRVMGDNPSWFRLNGGGRDLVAGLDTSSFPVESVSWQDARMFCERLTRQEPGKNYRLPSEAEWEYACRAGTMTSFHTGPELGPEQANFSSSTGKDAKTGRPGPVEEHPANAWGLFGMHGNVREWCADLYAEDAYVQKTPLRKRKEVEQSLRVIRGGAFHDRASGCRCAARGASPGNERFPFVGFRVAVEP